MDRLATVRHLIDSAEHPIQAMERVLDFLSVEIPSLLWVGIYLVADRRLEPGPWRGTQANGATGGRELALRAAFSGSVQQEGEVLAIPVLSQNEVRAVLALRSEQPETDFSPESQGLLETVVALLEPLA
jgi:putative methionine-R-sulfoxide reductase with GAF domain